MTETPLCRDVVLRASPYKGLKLSFGDMPGPGLEVVVEDVKQYVSGSTDIDDTLDVEVVLDPQYRVSDRELADPAERLEKSGWKT